MIVRELRSPIRRGALEALPPRFRLQFSSPLSATDFEELAHALQGRPRAELRVHGVWPGGFDLRALAALPIATLLIDARPLLQTQGLAALPELRALVVRSRDSLTLPFEDLPLLNRLDLTGEGCDLRNLRRASGLAALALRGTRAPLAGALAALPELRDIVLAHAPYALEELPELEELEALELRDMALPRFPALPRHLRRLTMSGVRLLKDLRPLRALADLEELRLLGMPQLDFADFLPLQGWEAPARLTIDVQSRSKSREAIRLLQGLSGQGLNGP